MDVDDYRIASKTYTSPAIRPTAGIACAGAAAAPVKVAGPDVDGVEGVVKVRDVAFVVAEEVWDGCKVCAFCEVVGVVALEIKGVDEVVSFWEVGEGGKVVEVVEVVGAVDLVVDALDEVADGVVLAVGPSPEPTPLNVVVPGTPPVLVSVSTYVAETLVSVGE